MKDSLTIHQPVNAPVAKVYEAWTDLETARKWSCPEGCELSRFDADFKIGGQYRLTMKTPGGDMSAYGTYLEVVPNQKLVYTWVWDVPDTEENLVVVEFNVKGQGSEIVLTVSGFTNPDEVDSNREGWASSLGRLAKRFA